MEAGLLSGAELMIECGTEKTLCAPFTPDARVESRLETDRLLQVIVITD